MNLPQYKTNPDEDLHSFSFISEGKNGKIEKVIRYEKITDDVFNLGFGDKDPITGKINDKVVTNNGDTEKVLATVVSTVFTLNSFKLLVRPMRRQDNANLTNENLIHQIE